PLEAVHFDPDGREEVRPADPARWGDAVLVRKETPTSYHLAVVHDDAAQGVTHVVRGRDLEAATDLHVLLQRLLGLPTPRYHHHALVEDSSGEKLSKSLRSESLADLRARGVTAQEVRRRLGF
ncbi:MAG TPA: glutamate--tRNA ligase family protein, partial [Beijerinckiaceae bacterium]|nr:glutamate--tRNA ligase family protein [Beijerinckiaceae bacterium]